MPGWPQLIVVESLAQLCGFSGVNHRWMSLDPCVAPKLLPLTVTVDAMAPAPVSEEIDGGPLLAGPCHA